jgi:hypothetical protein
MRNARCTTSVNDTGGKIADGINNTGSKFSSSINSACVVDTGYKFATAPVSTIPATNLPPVSTAPVAALAHNGNTIKPQAP